MSFANRAANPLHWAMAICLVLASLSPGSAFAQTVDAPPTNATCVENVAQREFACGNSSNAAQSSGTAVGFNAFVAGPGGSAFGQSAAAGSVATAIGDIANANAAGATAVGDHVNFTVTPGVFSTAVGTNTTATGFTATAIGSGDGITNLTSTGSGSVAIGFNPKSGGTLTNGFTNANTIAIGTNASAGALGANQADAIAIGANATASNINAIAIGQGSTATANNSVALGNGSIANVANTLSVGSAGNERRITNVAAGINPTDAVNVSQLTAIANNMNGAFQGQLNGLQNQVNNNLREARSGIALAMAAGSLQFDQRPGKFSVAGAYGNFMGYSGLAVGVGYAVSDRFRVNATFSGSPDQNVYGGVVSGSITLN